MPDMVGFKYGEFSALPEGTTNGTIYVAKAADGKAYMYVDKDGEKLNITSPNATFYGEADWVDEETINVNIDGFSLEVGSQITVKMPGCYTNNDIGTAPILNKTYLTVNNTAKFLMRFRNAKNYRTLHMHSIWTFVYSGDAWELIGEVDTVNNGIVISTNTRFVDDGDSGSWADYAAPLLVGNVPAIAVDVQGHFDSIKAFYVEGKTPTLVGDGTLQIPSGYLDIGKWGTYTQPYIRLLSDDIMAGNGQGALTISDNSINWQAFNIDGNCSLYFNETGIALGDDDIYGGRFANISSEEIWFMPNIYTDGSVYSASRRLPHVYYGTTTPSPSTGQNGDVYIMYS